MKKVLCILLSAISALSVYNVQSHAENNIYKEVYVSTNGNDFSDGSKNAPFRSIEKAKEYVKSISDDMTGDIVVNVEKGTYYLNDTIVFTNEDSGKNGHKIIYKGEDMPQLSGGVNVGNFEPTEYDGIYKAPVEGVTMMREMYVNGRKAYVASSNRTVKAIGYYQDPRTIYEYDGMIMSRNDIGEYENADEIECSWLVNWKYSTALVDKILPNPDNDDQVIVLMKQNWWERVSTYSDASYSCKPYREFEIKNAFELLDKPGEFYYNKKTKYVYYMPREGEDLSTAEIIAPRVDKIIKFDGNDEFDKVKNIRIEGFKIAHSAFYGVDEGGMENAQAQLASRTNGIPWYIPSGISIARAEGIELEGNYFYGFGAGCIEISDAVDKSVVNGNAFSDIGDAAIAVGKHYQGACSSTSGVSFSDQRVIPPSDAGECNLIDGKVKLTTSYIGNFNCLSGNNTWFSKEEENVSGYWESDPYAISKNEKSWIKYDFENRYSISKIKLGFDTSIPDDEKSGFEIILSNDREFKEENCFVAARQETPASKIQDYDIDTKGVKYRFLLIRTLGATQLAVSKVWAFTPDRKPYTTGVLTTDNAITNNYITRCGETILSGGGISVIYTRGLTIKNNEISYIPYSGIMMGWGWRNFDDTCQDNRIERNYVHHTNLLLDDGGGIYTLSKQSNSVVNENYITDVIQGRAAIYTDEGSSEFEIKSNVMENVVDDYFIWQSSIRDNKYLDGYGWIPQHRNDGTNVTVDPIKLYSPGNEPGKAYIVKCNAGIEEEYKYLKDLVPDTKLEITDERLACNYLDSTEVDYIERYVKETTQIMFEEGHFGDNYGDYPAHYYYDIKNALDEMTGYKNNDHFASLLKVRHLINEAADDIKRLSLEDMIKFCEDNLNNSVISNDRSKDNSVTGEAKMRFKNKIDIVKKAYNLSDEAQKRDLLLDLENANRDFEKSKLSSNIEYLYVEGMVDEDINTENKTVTLYMSRNIDLTKCKFEAICSGASHAAVFEDTINLTRDFEMPIYCPDNDKYTYWKINIRDINESKWTTQEYSRNLVSVLPNGNILLSPYKFAYLNSKYFGDNEAQKIYFKPNGTPNSKLILFFGVGCGKNFDYQSFNETNDSLRLEVVNGIGKIVKCEGGKDTVIKDNISIDIDFNKQNCVFIKAVCEYNGMYIYSVFVNQKLQSVFITDKKFNNGYTGICSEEMSVIVSNDN